MCLLTFCSEFPRIFVERGFFFKSQKRRWHVNCKTRFSTSLGLLRPGSGSNFGLSPIIGGLGKNKVFYFVWALKYGFCKKSLLYEWTSDQLHLTIYLHKIRFSCNPANIWKDIFFTLSECLSNVLITGDWESNFDERNGQEMFNWSEFHS